MPPIFIPIPGVLGLFRNFFSTQGKNSPNVVMDGDIHEKLVTLLGGIGESGGDLSQRGS